MNGAAATVTRVEKLLADAGVADANVECVDNECVVRVTPESMRPALESLHTSGFTMLVFITAVDRPPDTMTVVTRVGNLDWRAQVMVETDVPRDEAAVTSVADLWPA